MEDRKQGNWLPVLNSVAADVNRRITMTAFSSRQAGRLRNAYRPLGSALVPA
jgi:hypothetical protein